MILYFVWDSLLCLWFSLSRCILILSIFISIAYYIGWVDRFIWYMSEYAARDIWNGTPVTIGSVEVDILRGRVWMTDVVIHTNRTNIDEWKWKSPIICRVGKVYVESNWAIAQTILLLRRLWHFITTQQMQGIPPEPLEIYTVETSDIQVFVERKQHIFNFYLMDPCVILPDPRELREQDDNESIAPTAMTQQQQQHQNNNSDATIANQNSNVLSSQQHNNNNKDAVLESSAAVSNGQEDDETATEIDTVVGEQNEDQVAAQKLVGDIILAVKTLGEAAKQGSWTGALVEHRDTIKSKLKQIQENKNKTEAMQQGVRVIQRVGKAVAKKTKEGVLPMPKRKESEEQPFIIRVGRVIIRDVRIFTRVNNNNNNNRAQGIPQPIPPAVHTAPATNKAPTGTLLNTKHYTSKKQQPAPTAATTPAAATTGIWNRPIGIQEVIIRSADLCPPMSLLDENHLPALYQPIDKVMDVIWKRLIAGMAKANTTHFLRTALGEVLELEYSNLSTPSTSNNHLAVPTGASGNNEKNNHHSANNTVATTTTITTTTTTMAPVTAAAPPAPPATIAKEDFS